MATSKTLGRLDFDRRVSFAEQIIIAMAIMNEPSVSAEGTDERAGPMVDLRYKAGSLATESPQHDQLCWSAGILHIEVEDFEGVCHTFILDEGGVTHLIEDEEPCRFSRRLKRAVRQAVHFGTFR